MMPAPMITGGDPGALTGGSRRVRIAAPEGFSAHRSHPAHTIPGSLAFLHGLTRFHRRIYWPDYATKNGKNQHGLPMKPYSSAPMTP
jgi:hypothetical protein